MMNRHLTLFLCHICANSLATARPGSTGSPAWSRGSADITQLFRVVIQMGFKLWIFNIVSTVAGANLLTTHIPKIPCLTITAAKASSPFAEAVHRHVDADAPRPMVG